MKLVHDFWWPDYDYIYQPLKHVKDIDTVLKYVKRFDCCIQAGGNVGIFPKYLSQRFYTVHTFEPDRENFECLEMNTKDTNIFTYNKALSDTYEMLGVSLPRNEKNNSAANRVVEGSEQSVLIDDYNFVPDLIYLDLNGYELQALKGAKKTLNHHPVVAFEEQDGIIDFLKTFGYEVKARIRKDVICA